MPSSADDRCRRRCSSQSSRPAGHRAERGPLVPRCSSASSAAPDRADRQRRRGTSRRPSAEVEEARTRARGAPAAERRRGRPRSSGGPTSATPPPSTITAGSTTSARATTAVGQVSGPPRRAERRAAGVARWPRRRTGSAARPVRGRRPPAGDGRAGGHRLEAAPLAARARRVPAGSTGRCPISPATPCAPRRKLAVEHEPGGDPGPDAQVGEVGDTPMTVEAPTAAAFTSFSTAVGHPDGSPQARGDLDRLAARCRG